VLKQSETRGSYSLEPYNLRMFKSKSCPRRTGPKGYQVYTELDDGYYVFLVVRMVLVPFASSTTKPKLGFGLLRRLLCLSAGMCVSCNVLSIKRSRKRKIERRYIPKLY
jgi:hypothetical protein